jgi:hypothetical protein
MPVALNDDKWHFVTGSYNRWAKDGQRLKLYLDGKLVSAAIGADKPIWRGDNYLYVGKFSGGYFRGSIDEAMMFNFELSPAQVQALAAKYVNAALLSFGQGCSGINGELRHLAAGTPEPGKRIDYRIVSGPPGSVALLSLGLSNQRWGAFDLPLALDFAGANGCNLYTEPMFLLAVPLDRNGYASVPLTLASGSASVGLSHHTQFLALDPAANPLGITTSNGVKTLVGGAR